MPNPGEAVRGGKARVIVVEDERVQLTALAGCLARAGFDVTGVESVLEFYKALVKASFSLAVVDLKLPDYCGLELVEYLRKNTTMGIIVVSAQDADVERVKGYRAGADLYLVKPIHFHELASAAKNLVKRLGTESNPALPGGLMAPFRLVETSWHLVTPTGEAIKLTAKELQFLKCLADTPGMAVSRHLMQERLGYGDDEYALRNMDAVVRRLRMKISGAWNQSSPIKTIRTGGYCFSLPIIISNLLLP